MSLIKCPECGANIYTDVQQCMYCGCNLKNTDNKTINEKCKEEKIEFFMSTIDPPEDPSPLYKKNIRFYKRLKIITALSFSIVVTACLLYAIFIADKYFGKYLISISIIFSLLGAFLYWLIPKEDIETLNKIATYQKYLKDPDKWKREIATERYNELYNKKTYTKSVKNNDKPIVNCPYCGSSNVIKVSTASRVVSTAAVGIASKKIGKQWKCNNCKSYF